MDEQNLLSRLRHGDEQALAALIAEEFEVSPEEALADTQGLIESMRNAGWIE